jgi:UDP-glucose 4-epimerase
MNQDKHPIDIIGTRHGEKLYEALCSREEMLVAEDQGQYYRIPADNRDLNYEKFFEEGDTKITKLEDYNSHNTTRLDVEGMKALLLKLEFIQALTQGHSIDPEA